MCIRDSKTANPISAIVKAKKDGDALATFTIDRPDMQTYPALEFWRMKKVSVLEHATMELTMIDARVPLPDLGPSMPHSVVVQVPAAILCKKVVPGSELVLFIPAKAKQVDERKVLSLSAGVEPKPKRGKRLCT